MADHPTPAAIRPRVYVASLADYNNGRHHGLWIDAAQDVADIFSAIGAMLAQSRVEGAEEWAIHDHEGFAPLRIGENAAIRYVSEAAKGICEFGEAYAVWLSLCHGEPSQGFAEMYLGELAADGLMPTRPVSAIVVPTSSGTSHVFRDLS